ncbi:MAG: hypothetical protein O2960_29930 [Verrucomicrobia bacterium]|nr:hypothetical protein [Verrucomicrobiota bacterium]
MPPDPEASYAILQVEKATGHNTPPASGGYPDLLYFDGSADYPEPGKVIQNNVFLLQRR